MTLPTAIRELAGIKIGDYVKIGIEKGKITITPQSLIDRELAMSLEDVKQGKVYGPFDTVAELTQSLKGTAIGKSRGKNKTKLQ